MKKFIVTTTIYEPSEATIGFSDARLDFSGSYDKTPTTTKISIVYISHRLIKKKLIKT